MAREKWHFIRYMPEGNYRVSEEDFPTEELARQAAFGYNGYGGICGNLASGSRGLRACSK